MRALPWLQHLEKREGFAESVSAAEAEEGAVASSSEQPLLVLEEEILFAAVASMEAARSAMAAGAGPTTSDFAVRMRTTTEESAARSGDAGFDAAQSIAKHDMAIAFCKRRKEQSTFRISYSKASNETVGVLMREWCRRMQFYYDLEVRSKEGPALAFGAAHHEAYEEATDFAALATSPANVGEVRKRIEHIRRMFARR